MYQIVIMDAIGTKAAILQATLEQRARDLNLDPLTDLCFNPAKLDPASPRVGVLFSDGPAGLAFAPDVQPLLDSPATVIPVVQSLADFAKHIPQNLRTANGLELDPADPALDKVASLVLELFGLLRKRRRLFISYKRNEAAAVAHQLHNALDERTFDVFLDTLSIRPAAQFQEQLWHRMTDSDLVILLYTASVHQSGWVQQEIDRAAGMGITVLQLIWPGVARNPATQIFEPVYLQPADFDPARPDELASAVVAKICTQVESLRARSLRRREDELVGPLRDSATSHNVTAAIHPARYVDITKPKTAEVIRIIPAVGVPDSESFHDPLRSPAGEPAPNETVLLYDPRHLIPAWDQHLDWLNTHLPVKTVKLPEIGKWIAAL